MEKKTKPTKSVRVGGICVAIWEEQQKTRDGESFTKQKVVLDKTYRDSSGNFASTGRLDPNDIPKAILALSKAYEIVVGVGVRSPSNGETTNINAEPN